jgi:NADH-quinone oxidoreductase subunit E
MLDMAYIRALEVASFYFMFQLQPVGSVAHIQICGTTPCMLCGSEDLVAVCRDKIAARPHELSADGKLSWEEVECLGACANAPMAQIGKDYYEDLTAEGFGKLLDEILAGRVPVPGPQNGRFASEPKSGLTSLTAGEEERLPHNASVQLATEHGETLKRIDGSETPLNAPWQTHGANHQTADPAAQAGTPPAAVIETGPSTQPPDKSDSKAKPEGTSTAPPPAEDVTGVDATQPELLTAARPEGPDDLKRIKGVGPKLEQELNEKGVYHYDQIAAWSDAEVAWADQHLVRFKGRVSRDEWVAQAKILAGGGAAEFSRKITDNAE